MCEHRSPLNKQTHSVRTAQAVLQYGAGALVDFPDQTLVTAAPELWQKTMKIYDERFTDKNERLVKDYAYMSLFQKYLIDKI
mgnify:CR=1 FL=1